MALATSTEPREVLTTRGSVPIVDQRRTLGLTLRQRLIGAAMGAALWLVVGLAVGRAVSAITGGGPWSVLGPALGVVLGAALGWRLGGELFGFTVPALTVFVLFVFVPIAYALVLSLFGGTRTAPLSNFLGFDNFVNIFTQSRGATLGQPWFWDAVRNNFFIAALSMLIQGPLAVAVALLLNRRMRFRGVVRLLIFVPYVISEVITGVMFSLILSPQGALNDWLTRIGLDGFANTMWLMDTSPVTDPGFFSILGSRTFWIIFAIMTWKYIGLAIILFLAGLSGIPQELTEAAEVDGATWWQTQRRITIPLLAPTIRIWAFLSIIGSFQLFDMVWIMTSQAPGRTGMHTMATFMVDQGMNQNRIGYGSAIAIVLFVITLAIALVYQKFVLHRDVAQEVD